MFLADLIPHTLKNIPVVMLVNCLARRNKFMMMNNTLAVKDHQHALDIHPDLPCFLWVWKGWAFPMRGLLFGFWVVTMNSDFVS
jgi:hypothetical protein